MINMLHHVLRDVEVYTRVSKRKCFQILAANSIDNTAWVPIGKKLRGDIERTLLGETLTCSSVAGRRLMDYQASPIWEVGLNSQHQRPLARYTSTIGAKVVISQPRVVCHESRLGGTGGTISIVLKHWRRLFRGRVTPCPIFLFQTLYKRHVSYPHFNSSALQSASVLLRCARRGARVGRARRATER